MGRNSRHVGQYSLDVVGAVLGLDLLPAGRETLFLQRVAPVRRLRVVVDVILAPHRRPVDGPAERQRQFALHPAAWHHQHNAQWAVSYGTQFAQCNLSTKCLDPSLELASCKRFKRHKLDVRLILKGMSLPLVLW